MLLPTSVKMLTPYKCYKLPCSQVLTDIKGGLYPKQTLTCCRLLCWRTCYFRLRNILIRSADRKENTVLPVYITFTRVLIEPRYSISPSIFTASLENSCCSALQENLSISSLHYSDEFVLEPKCPVCQIQLQYVGGDRRTSQHVTFGLVIGFKAPLLG